MNAPDDRDLTSEEEREIDAEWPVFVAKRKAWLREQREAAAARARALAANGAAAPSGSSSQPVPSSSVSRNHTDAQTLRRATSATVPATSSKVLGKRKSPDADDDVEPIDSTNNHSVKRRGEVNSSREGIDTAGSGKAATSGDKDPRGKIPERNVPVGKKPKLAVELPSSSSASARRPSAQPASSPDTASPQDQYHFSAAGTQRSSSPPVPRSSSPPDHRSLSPAVARSSPIVTASSSVPRRPVKKAATARPSSPVDDVSTWTPAPRRNVHKGTLAEVSTITTPGAGSSVQCAASGVVYKKPPPPLPALFQKPVVDKGKGKMAPLPPAPPRPAVKKADTAPVIDGKEKASGSKTVKNAESARPATKKAASTPAPSTSTSAPAAAKKAPAKKGGKPKVQKMLPKDWARHLIANKDTMCKMYKEKDQFLKGQRVLFFGKDHSLAGEPTMNKMRIIIERGGELIPEWDPANQPTLIISECKNEHLFMEKCGIKSMDEIPIELDIVCWDWTLRPHRPHWDFPALTSRIPIVPGLMEKMAEAEEKQKRARELRRTQSAYSSNSSRESTPERPERDYPSFIEDAPVDPLAEFYEQARAERNAEEETTGVDMDETGGMVRHGSDGRELKGFLCDGASKPKAKCPNQDVIDKLIELQDVHKAKSIEGDNWRVYSLTKSIRALKEYPTRLKSEEEAKKIDGVGAKTAQKIMEIIRTGDLRRINHERTDDFVTMQLFQGIYGVGPNKAREWYQAGARTLEDLKEGKFGIKLTAAQKIGLDNYDDLQKRMPRSEAGAIFAAIKPIAYKIDPKLVIEIMGSYRRRKETCGDIDVFITRPKDDGWTHTGILPQLFKALHAAGILTDDLSLPDDPAALEGCYRGLCVLPGGKGVRRRIDILAIPWESRGAALIYYTGDDIFNRSLRLKANKMGMSLNQRGLFAGVVRDADRVKTNKGKMIAGESESEIFQKLGVPWQEPWERVRN
ncbi:hypothetical protein PENSPDRAFT_654747 [Peniophora sp. CONT]|nr:hypothetical protein PENSPDRAFT_654747 [Peniophora sp. CONT]